MGEPLRIEVREEPDQFVVTLAGDEMSPIEIDEMRRAVERVLTGSDTKPVVMDLTHLLYLSSEAVGILAAAHRDLAARDRAMTVRNPTPAVLRVFTVTRLDRFLHIEPRPASGPGA